MVFHDSLAPENFEKKVNSNGVPHSGEVEGSNVARSTLFMPDPGQIRGETKSNTRTTAAEEEEEKEEKRPSGVACWLMVPPVKQIFTTDMI
jgi:hypothetical protein